MSILTYKTRVSYDDIDQNMNLTLKGVLGYMQEAAMIHSGQVGYSVADVERTHVTWMLVQWRVRILSNVPWGTEVTVNTWPRSMDRATSIRNFEVFDGFGQKVAIGESNWVLVNVVTGRITRITSEVASAYDLTDRDVFEDALPELPAAGGEPAWSGIVALRDIDTNRHVNNRVYLDYAREALPEGLRDCAFREVSVRYRKQLLLGDRMQCKYRCDANKHFVDICNESGTVVHGTVCFQ